LVATHVDPGLANAQFRNKAKRLERAPPPSCSRERSRLNPAKNERFAGYFCIESCSQVKVASRNQNAKFSGDWFLLWMRQLFFFDENR
jgi:hypothetical protein